jgi:hypothetical protein
MRTKSPIKRQRKRTAQPAVALIETRTFRGRASVRVELPDDLEFNKEQLARIEALPTRFPGASWYTNDRWSFQAERLFAVQLDQALTEIRAILSEGR